MPVALAETLAVAILVLSLVVAVTRPFGLSEAVVAVPGAVVVVLTGILPAHAALERLKEIGPTVGFLAAILVFGHLCAEAGVFDYLGTRAALASGGRPRRLLVLVVVLAASVTAVLTLDATVVLLTPVVLTTVHRMRIAARPHAYACTHLANSGSLLLPVSNLTNLLAFAASGLSFGHFAALMALPWVLACAIEWAGLRTFFSGDLPADAVDPGADAPPAPRYALGVLALTVRRFRGDQLGGRQPGLGGDRRLRAAARPAGAARRECRCGSLAGEASPGFCLFVLALAVIVEGVTKHGLGDGLRHLMPDTTTLGALLVAAFLAAAVANLVNNLPATLALIPIVTGQPALVLAVLIGVNVGPNATYPGSLATLLWRRLLPDDAKPKAAQFHLLGALTVPVILAVTTVALWGGYQLIG